MMDEEMRNALLESGLDMRNVSSRSLFDQHSKRDPGCDLCKSGMALMKDLLVQCGVVTKDRQFVCEICFKSYVLATTLARHILRHKKDEAENSAIDAVNETVDNSMEVSNELNNLSHKLRKSSSGVYICYICFKRFAHRNSLTRHHKIHSGVRQQYMCEACQKVFHYKNSLKRHKCIGNSRKAPSNNDDILAISSDD